MKNINHQITDLQDTRNSLVKQSHDFINVWFSTRTQLKDILYACNNQEDIEVVLFLDKSVEYQQKSIAFQAMSLLPSENLTSKIILPNAYSQDIVGLHHSELTQKDFRELFHKFWEDIYINYQDAIDEIGWEEAYAKLEMYLARKKFISNELFKWENVDNKQWVIVQASNIKWANSVFTKWNLNNRSNRNNLFIRADY